MTDNAPVSRTPTLDLLEIQSGMRREARKATEMAVVHDVKWPKFDEIAAETVVLALAQGVPESKLAQIGGLPARRVIRYWRQSNPDFNEQCIAAEEDATDQILSEMDVIADDTNRLPQCRKVSLDHRKWKVEHLSERFKQQRGDSLSITQTNINVEGDAAIAPADSYLRMLNGG